MEPLPVIPRFNTPSGLPETFEEFEKLKSEQREALRRYWEAQPEGDKKKALGLLFTKRAQDIPETWVGMEAWAEISEDELDQIKSVSRREQQVRWEQMSPEERQKLRETTLPATEVEPEPFSGTDLE
jgi:hypothetical protein